ncbi:hypothetical protein HMPREF3191_00878 [Veillonellaceae bacterium DNF00626]|nr:hypothetical protein HMPREF3191_00878 [Veillonellaceae bacterium DNF00626]
MTNHFFDLQLFAETTIPAALVEKAWGKDVWAQALKDSYFEKFTGTGNGYIIDKMTNLKKEAGDTIVIPLLKALTGTGVTDDAQLEGQEEALQFYDFAVQVHEKAHAVKLKGKLEEQKTAIDLRKHAKQGLATWLTYTIDQMVFDALTANPTDGRKIFAGGKTSEGSITTADVFTADLIGVAKRKARLAHVRPVVVNGTKHYVLVVNPYQARDLKNDAKWIDAQKYANIRGNDNPIFTGALGMYDNVIIHEHENVKITETGSGSAAVGHALLMGAQAGAFAIAQEAEWNEKVFDYGRKYGVSVSTIFGIAKSKFDGEDFSTVQVMTACKAD